MDKFSLFDDFKYENHTTNELPLNKLSEKDKSIIKEWKHFGLYFTCADRGWEFHFLPFFDISSWRIFGGWLCFTFQYTFRV